MPHCMDTLAWYMRLGVADAAALSGCVERHVSWIRTCTLPLPGSAALLPEVVSVNMRLSDICWTPLCAGLHHVSEQRFLTPLSA
jgi:hypothetical protein